MTLLSTVQEAAEEAGFRPPSSVVGNSDATARRFRRAAVATAEDLLEAHPWSILTKAETITTTASAVYALPSDFHRGIPDTTWNRTQRWRQAGSVAPAMWQTRIAGWVVSTSLNSAFRVIADSGEKKIRFDPTPTAGETITYEYVSAAMFSNAGVLETTWAADGWTCLLDESLIRRGIIWRIMRSVGREYVDLRRDYERDKSLAIAQDVPAESIYMGERDYILPAVTPETGYGT